MHVPRARFPALGRRGVIAAVLLLLGCAHARDPWDAEEAAEARRAALEDPGRICHVRIESAYDRPVELAYRAGPHALSVGIVQPDDHVEVGVPCEEESIVVYAVRPRRGAARDLWVRPTRHDLDPLRTIQVVVRPPAGPRG